MINDNIYLPTFYLSLLSPIFFSITSSFLIHISLSLFLVCFVFWSFLSLSILFFDTTSLYFSFPSLFLVFLSFSRPPTLYFHSTFFLLICLTSVRSFKSLILLLSHIDSFKMPSVFFFNLLSLSVYLYYFLFINLLIYLYISSCWSFFSFMTLLLSFSFSQSYALSFPFLFSLSFVLSIEIRFPKESKHLASFTGCGLSISVKCRWNSEINYS